MKTLFWKNRTGHKFFRKAGGAFVLQKGGIKNAFYKKRALFRILNGLTRREQLLFIIIEAFFGEVFIRINNTNCVKNKPQRKWFFGKRNLERNGGGKIGSWRKNGAFL
ncbi:MAG: hypothetical protein IKL18_06205 [Oscillospiraceae bacterium]|nr:hypothetical protein [Oscillospiraceae bacterium]